MNYFKIMFTFLGLFLICYGLGSFVEASFDLRTWEVFTRTIVGGFGGIISLIISIAKENEDKRYR